jgi:hypothetical protein
MIPERLFQKIIYASGLSLRPEQTVIAGLIRNLPHVAPRAAPLGVQGIIRIPLLRRSQKQLFAGNAPLACGYEKFGFSSHTFVRSKIL